MGQQRDDLLLRQPGPKQRRAFSLGETGFAGRTVQHPPFLVGPVTITHTQVTGIPFAIVATLRVLATEPSEVVHGLPSVAREPNVKQSSLYKTAHLACNTSKTPEKYRKKTGNSIFGRRVLRRGIP